MIDFIKGLFKPKADFMKLVSEGAVIVDVRAKAEYPAGHIEGSKNLPLDIIRNEAAALKKLNKPLITVCSSGNRSSMAKLVLAKEGIEVYNGGAWTSLKKQIQ